MGDFDTLFASLDADNNSRGRQFERICQWFLTNDPYYKSLFKSVWLWREWPGAWSGTEAGIDLVATDTNDLTWAVQCKAYESQKKIPKRELNKFLSESNRKEFDHRLLMSTTTSGLHHIAQGTVDAQEKAVAIIDLGYLQTSPIDWPTDLSALRPSPPTEPAQPRDYQRDAIRDVVRGFDNSHRGQLIMACGTGKTLTSLFIKERLEAQRTLVLVPSLSLLKQTMRVWYSNKTEDFDSLPVCSDDTVRRDEDAAVTYVSDLGMPVTTEPAEIAWFLRKPAPQVMFATYQSSPQIAKAFTHGGVPSFDLVIADEAHRCAGPVSSDFATAIDDTAIPAVRRLFMTATPRYFTERVIKAAIDADFEYASMDDEAKFGRVFHRLGFSDAISRGLLTDYQVAIIGVDDATYRDWAEKGTLVTFDGKTPTNARTLAGQIGLAKAMRKFNLRRTISFHSRVSSAQRFAASMQNVLAWMPAEQRPVGRLWSEHASGTMPAGERYRLLRHLSELENNELGLLSNARCLAEGVDVPTLDGVAFIDPRRSEVDIVQAVGRAIRKAHDKTLGTIVIPVYIDTTEDPEVALDRSTFKPVWDVIRALRSHDDELGRQLDELRREMGRLGARPRSPDKIHHDLPVRVDCDFAAAFEARLVTKTTESWEFWFGLLERYSAERETARVPVDCIFEGHKLGAWALHQRNRYNVYRRITAPQVDQLEALPGWTWDLQDDAWDRGFDYLTEYVSRYGTSYIAMGYTVDGYKLGSWVNNQRAWFRTKRLSHERRRRLESLKGWTWDVREDRWSRGYEALRAYITLHGDALVPSSYTVDGYRLGGWVRQQRVDKAAGDLSEEREKLLEDLGCWIWNTRHVRVSRKAGVRHKPLTWDEAFRTLRDYVAETGDALLPASVVVDGFPLGKWLVEQRARKAGGGLEAERVEKLETLDGWAWDSRDEKWERGFQLLLEYLQQHGDTLVPKGHHVRGYNLGSWVSNQRSAYLRDTLTPERRDRLNALNGWAWNSKTAQWEGSFNRLLEYVAEHGDANVPNSWIVGGDFKLGKWVSQQRNDWRKGVLTYERQERLASLPGWVWKTTRN